jgi:hypothetical protein
VKQFTARGLRSGEDATRRRHPMVTFEKLVTTAIFVGWLSTVIIFTLE